MRLYGVVANQSSRHFDADATVKMLHPKSNIYHVIASASKMIARKNDVRESSHNLIVNKAYYNNKLGNMLKS